MKYLIYLLFINSFHSYSQLKDSIYITFGGNVFNFLSSSATCILEFIFNSVSNIENMNCKTTIM